jgi:hypothetical protein
MTTMDGMVSGAMDEPKPEPGIKLTEQQLRARRARSIAIAVSLGVLVVLFYVGHTRYVDRPTEENRPARATATCLSDSSAAVWSQP